MGKYDPLFRHLVAADASASVEMSFDEIEQLVGLLPASASQYSAWWNNEGPATTHVKALAGLNAGREVKRVGGNGRRVRSGPARGRLSSYRARLRRREHATDRRSLARRVGGHP